MPNDYVTLKAISEELNNFLSQGKINKISMDYLDVFLTIRGKNGTKNLLLSCAPNRPGFYLTSQKTSGHIIPSAFCMLLRKYLTGGVVEGFELLNNDRILSININAKNELFDYAKYRLIVEVMGGGSNIILAHFDYKIIDAVKRVINEKRTILPHQTYLPPSQDKKLLTDSHPSLVALQKKINNSENGEKLFATEISKSVSGLSKESIKEVVYMAKNNTCIEDVFCMFDDIYHSPHYSPSLLYQEGKVKGFFPIPYQSILGEWEGCESLNIACDKFYSTLSKEGNKQRDTREIRKKIKRLKSKNSKKIAQNIAIMGESDNKERLLELAEILKSNIYRIKKSEDSITCYDFYNDKEVDIPLDNKLSPPQNVAQYYKKYHKLKGAIAYAEKEQEELLKTREYLLSIEVSLDSSDTPEEFAEIEKELEEFSPSPNKKNRGRITKKKAVSSPITLEYDGFTVYIGRNNYQNEEVTFKLGRAEDIWLHAKNYHGSHGIILASQREVPLSVIKKAGEKVAFLSGGKNSSKVEVDYTAKKNVKKLGKPGLVSYTNYKTILVEPKPI